MDRQQQRASQEHPRDQLCRRIRISKPVRSIHQNKPQKTFEGKEPTETMAMRSSQSENQEDRRQDYEDS